MKNQSEIDQRRHLDKLQTSAWLHQMSAIWNLNRFASAIEVGAIVGWYFLFVEHHDYVLTSALLLLSSILLYFVVFTVRRQVQILKLFATELHASEVIPPQKELPAGIFGKYGRLYAHDYAVLFPTIPIVANACLAFYSIPHADCTNYFVMFAALAHPFLLILICFQPAQKLFRHLKTRIC